MEGLEELRKKQKPTEGQPAAYSEIEEETITIPANQLSTDFNHLLCRNCVKALNNKFAHQISETNDKPIELKCNICCESHKINKKAWRVLCKDASGGCCIIF